MNPGDIKVRLLKPEIPKMNLKTANIFASQIKKLKNEEIKAILTGEEGYLGYLGSGLLGVVPAKQQKASKMQLCSPHHAHEPVPVR